MKMKAAAVIVMIAVTISLLLTGCVAGVNEKIKYKDVEGGVALYRYSGVSVVKEFSVPDEHEGKPVVEMMKYAISGAEYLTTIKIGKNIKTIDNWAITYCPNLESITVDPANPYYESEDGVLYNKGKTELIVYPLAKVKLVKDSAGYVTGGAEFTVPETVEKISETAFYQCSNLYKISFHEGLLEIGNYAFMKCVNLTSFTLPSTLKKIGTDAFSYCDAITSLTIPASVEYIGDYAFFSLSSSLTVIYIEKPLSQIAVGKDWLPNKKGQVNGKVAVEEMRKS